VLSRSSVLLLVNLAIAVVSWSSGQHSGANVDRRLFL
jgi:hypothetical protein